MGKEQYKKITLEALIAKKEQALSAKAKKKTADLYVKSLDGIITIQAPDAKLMRDIMEMEDGNEYLVYQCCIDPPLKNAALQEGEGVPHEVVYKLFDPGEIAAISMKCAELVGYGDNSVRLVDEIKN